VAAAAAVIQSAVRRRSADFERLCSTGPAGDSSNAEDAEGFFTTTFASLRCAISKCLAPACMQFDDTDGFVRHCHASEHPNFDKNGIIEGQRNRKMRNVYDRTLSHRP